MTEPQRPEPGTDVRALLDLAANRQMPDTARPDITLGELRGALAEARAAERTETPDAAGWPDDSMLEAAWGIIANAGGGNWETQTAEWQEAATRWREAYHRALVADPRPPEPRQRIQFVVNPAMFGEGPPGDPFPCDCGEVCVVPEHNRTVQEWYRRNVPAPEPEPPAQMPGQIDVDDDVSWSPLVRVNGTIIDLEREPLDTVLDEIWSVRLRLIANREVEQALSELAFFVVGVRAALPEPPAQLDVERLREAIEAEWYNGNIDQGAYERLIVVAERPTSSPDAPAAATGPRDGSEGSGTAS